LGNLGYEDNKNMKSLAILIKHLELLFIGGFLFGKVQSSKLKVQSCNLKSKVFTPIVNFEF